MTTRPTGDPPPRDPHFDTAWRNASREEPPAALDAAIRAAAHRGVGAKPQSLVANAAMRARRRWWPLAAAATVAVIAIGVVQRAGHDQLVVPPGGSAIVTDMPAQTAKSVAETPQRAPETPRASEAPRAPEASKPDEGRARVDSGAAPPAARKARSAASADALSEPFPAASPKPGAVAPRDATSATPAPANTGDVAAAAPAPQVSSQVASPGAPMAERSAESVDARRQETARSTKPATPPMPPAASFADSTRVSGPSAMRSSAVAKTANAGGAEEARIKENAPLPVNDWIALIRRLRDEGKSVEAARELTAFRAAHADHEKLLPPDLRDWHPPEK